MAPVHDLVSRDGLVSAVFIVMLVVLSWTAVLTMRQSAANSASLKLIERCVLPAGDLCKGDPAQTQQLVDSVVQRVNAHTDEVVGSR